jgi:choline kinase
MKVLILAAGRGSRLGAVAGNLPKCLTPLFGRSLIEWQLATLAREGTYELHIVRGFAADKLTIPNATAWLNPEWPETNMVHSMFCARPVLETADELLITYGDIVYEPKVLQAMRQTPGDVVVAVNTAWLPLWRERMDDPTGDVESLKLSGDGRIIAIGDKVSDLSEVEGQYMGLLKFSRRGLDALIAVHDEVGENPAWAMGRSLRKCYMTDMVRGLIQAGIPVRPAMVDGGWLEVDTPEDLAAYNRLAGAGRLDQFWRSQP